MRPFIACFACLIIAVAFFGCAAYEGERQYDVTKPSGREDEKQVSEKYTIIAGNEQFNVRCVRIFNYMQKSRTYTVKERIYRVPSTTSTIGHIIFCPITFVISPLALIVGGGEVKYLGYTYIQNRGRDFWNFFNPIISLSGKRNFEINVVSHKDNKRPESRKEDFLLHDGNMTVTFADKKLRVPVGVSLADLRGKIFEHSLPEKNKNIEIRYRDTALKINIDSASSLSEDQLKLWHDFHNISDAAANSRYHEFKQMLNNFAEQKIISKSTLDLESARLNKMAEKERKRLAEEQRRLLKEAKEKYQLLSTDLEKLYTFSQKQNLTDDEYEQALKCSQKILSANCDNIIIKLEDGKMISHETASKNRIAIDYAENAIKYPCRDYMGIHLGKFYAGVSKLYLSRQSEDFEMFEFTTINGWEVACGTRSEVHNNRELDIIKEHYSGEFTNLNIRDRSRDHLLSMPHGNFLALGSCSYRNYDIIMENEKVIITITGNLVNAKIDTIVPDEWMSDSTKHEMMSASESLKRLAEKLMQQKGIENAVTITIIDKKMKKLGY